MTGGFCLTGSACTGCRYCENERQVAEWNDLNPVGMWGRLLGPRLSTRKSWANPHGRYQWWYHAAMAARADLPGKEAGTCR